MADNVLTKTQTVAEYSPVDGVANPERPRFVTGEEGDGQRRSILFLDHEVWEEFGRPEALTLTIEPGDTLNT